MPPAKIQDTKDIGHLTLRLMELGTYLADPKTLKLQHPEHWDDAIKDFLLLTQTGTSAELRKV